MHDAYDRFLTLPASWFCVNLIRFDRETITQHDGLFSAAADFAAHSMHTRIIYAQWMVVTNDISHTTRDDRASRVFCA